MQKRKDNQTLAEAFTNLIKQFPYNSIYFSGFYDELQRILFTLVDINLLTYGTAKSIILILKATMDEVCVISPFKDSVELQLSKRDGSLETISMDCLLQWMMTELLKDSLLSKAIDGQTGIMGFLDLLSNFTYPENTFSENIDALDLFIYKNDAYYTALDVKNKINLYYQKDILNSSTQTVPPRLLHSNLNDSKIFFDATKKCICINDLDVFHLCYYLRSKRIAFEPHPIAGNDETSIIYFKDFLTKMPLKARELAWKSIVAQCYTFHLNIKQNLSDRLKLYEFFKPPLCLSIKEIHQKMNFIEKGILDHKITINENYYVNFLRILLLLEAKNGSDYDLLNELVASKSLRIRLDIEPIQEHIVTLLYS